MTEMEKALQADGEKLAALTGEDHGPFCPACLGTGEGDAGECPCAECYGTGKLAGSIHDPDARCHAGRDGECNWPRCPQNIEGEPMKSGRHCPLDNWEEF